MPYFGFCSAPSAKKTIKQRSEFYGCRESFGELLEDQLSNGENSQIPIKRARIIAYIVSSAKSKESLEVANKKFADGMKIAVKVLNILEKRAKWRLTKFYRVVKDNSPKALMYMVVGSNNWIRSPHMQSMYCLILRACRSECFAGVKTYKDLMVACEKFGNSRANDATYVQRTYPYWGSITKNFNSLFENLSMKDNFNRKNYGDSSLYHEGIYNLCKGDSENKKITANFNKYCPAEKI
jgi:hypothetical protein